MKLYRYISIFISTLFFGVLLIFWGMYYPNHLVQKEQMQLFMTNTGYFFQHLKVQGGFAIYLGEFFTQFFLFPWVGVVMVSGIIFSVYYGIRCILNQLSPNGFSVLAFFPAMGYCFLLCNDFYCLSGALAVALAIWTVVVYLKIKEPVWRTSFGFLAIPLIYWLLGGAYILFVLSVISAELIIHLSGERQLKSVRLPGLYVLVCVVWGGIVPLVTRRFLLFDTLLQSYYSAAYYKFTLVFPYYLKLIFGSVPLILLLHFIFYRYFSEKGRTVLQLCFGVLLITGLVAGFNRVPDFAEEKEMMYDNLVNRQQWDEIIKKAEEELPAGARGKLSLTLALGQTNQLGSRLFDFSPQRSDFFISYKVHGMAPLIANEPYFYLGLINFSQMLAMESIDSTPDAVMPVRAMKRYAETCIITGQYDVAAKFLGYLRETMFYSRWAKEASSYLYNDEKVKAHPLWGKLRASQVKDEFNFKFDWMDVMLFSLLRGNPQNRMAYEYLMSSYLLQKDLDKFLEFLPLVKSMRFGELPLAYQEALAYTKTLVKEWPAALNEYKINDSVNNHLKAYAGAFMNGGSKNPAAMKQSFGRTFWYYVHFNKSDEKN
jgi:hypothetical protein